MTLPINCPHSKDGWCQVCAKRMGDDLRKAQEAALRWYEAASPYATPEALRAALLSRPEAAAIRAAALEEAAKYVEGECIDCAADIRRLLPQNGRS
jgi:hypothetical protein